MGSTRSAPPPPALHIERNRTSEPLEPGLPSRLEMRKLTVDELRSQIVVWIEKHAKSDWFVCFGKRFEDY